MSSRASVNLCLLADVIEDMKRVKSYKKMLKLKNNNVDFKIVKSCNIVSTASMFVATPQKRFELTNNEVGDVLSVAPAKNVLRPLKNNVYGTSYDVDINTLPTDNLVHPREKRVNITNNNVDMNSVIAAPAAKTTSKSVNITNNDVDVDVNAVKSLRVSGHAPEAEIAQLGIKTCFGSSVVKVMKKNNKWQVCMPKQLHGSKRIYIQFRRRGGQGTSKAFGVFIYSKLKPVVTAWKTLEQARKWCANDHGRKMWKYDVGQDWTSHQKYKTGYYPKTVDLSQIQDSPLAYTGFKSGANIIGIPEYADTPVDLRMNGKVMSIRVRVQSAYGYKRAFVYIRLPSCLVQGGRVKKINMGTQFSDNPNWLAFVIAYVTYAVCNCGTFKELRKWCNREIVNFASLLNRHYLSEGGNRQDTHFWSIRPSNVPIEKQYIKDGSFQNSTVGAGAGLFCAKPGAHKIYFGGQEVVTERIDKKKEKVSKKAGFYQIQVGDDLVDVPTAESLKAKVLHIGFVVNHNSKNPTHTSVFDTKLGIALLEPLRKTSIGEEFCFDYRYHKSDNKSTNPTDDESSSSEEPCSKRAKKTSCSSIIHV